jgi:TonB family protein
MLYWLSIMVAATGAAPVKELSVPISIVEIDPREDRARARRDAALCRMARRSRGLEALFARDDLTRWDIRRIGDAMARQQRGCTGDLSLPIAIFERLAGPDALRTNDPEAMIALVFALRDRARTGDALRADELYAQLWLRGDVSFIVHEPWWSVEERRAFIAREDIWAFISASPMERWRPQTERIAALLDPLSPRHDRAEAINVMEAAQSSISNWIEAARMLDAGDGVPVDHARAMRLLARAARFDEATRLVFVPRLTALMAGLTGAARRAIAEPLWQIAEERTQGGALARAALTPVLLEDLGSADTRKTRTTAVGALQRQVALGTPEAEAPLLRWTSAHLANADAGLRNLAFGALGTLLTANNAHARDLLARDMTRVGGVFQRAPLTLADGNAGTFINSEDYPASAARREEAGIVQATVLFDPSGRVIAVEITGSSMSQRLDQEVVRTAMRRLRLPADERGERYVRAALPLIVFIIPDAPSPPRVEGAIIIEAPIIVQTLQSVTY